MFGQGFKDGGFIAWNNVSSVEMKIKLQLFEVGTHATKDNFIQGFS